MEQENELQVEEGSVSQESETQAPSPQKKNLKWLYIAIAAVLVAGVAAWWLYNVITAAKAGAEYTSIYKLSALLAGLFLVTSLGYLLGRVTIKGVSLGTAGVFLVAILFGFLCTLIPSDMTVLGVFHLEKGHVNVTFYKSVIQNVGLVMFVGSVGFIAGPKFFRDLAKNFKTYIVMGIVIILAGTAVAVAYALIPGAGGKEFAAGILSGALTSTPGFSAAEEVATNPAMVTLGHAIAYPFGVVGVVLFVQLMPKFLKADMEKERSFLSSANTVHHVETKKEGLFQCDPFGLTALALAIVAGLIVGAVKIPLTSAGFSGACFSLGTTGGVLIMCLVFGHFGRIGKLSLEVPANSAKVLRELGLMLFLIGAGVEGGVSLVATISSNESGAMIVVWGLIGGAIMTIVPMIVGFFLGSKVLKLPLLNNLGSITGGMTSTPALGTLINTAETEDVASAYASTYTIALVLIVLACNLMIGLL